MRSPGRSCYQGSDARPGEFSAIWRIVFPFNPMANATTKDMEVSAAKAEGTAATTAATAAKKRPIKTLVLDDCLVSIWSRDHEGRTYFSLTTERSYTDKGGKRQYTAFLPLESLPKFVTLFQQAQDAIAELQQELSADARQATDAAKEPYEHARTQLGSAVIDLGSHISESIGHIEEDVHSIVTLFHDLKQEIVGTLENLGSVRRDVLALTSPLRETTATVAEALKVATEVFEGVG